MNDKKTLINYDGEKPKKTLLDIIHNKPEKYLVPDSYDDESGMDYAEEQKETIEYFQNTLEAMTDENGVVNLDSLFVRLTTNMATKSVASDILFQKAFSLLNARMDQSPALISTKDLVNMLHFSSKQSTDSAQDLQKLLKTVTDVRNYEEEQKKMKQKKDPVLSQLTDQQKNLIATVTNEIEAKLSHRARKNEEDDNK